LADSGLAATEALNLVPRIERMATEFTVFYLLFGLVLSIDSFLACDGKSLLTFDWSQSPKLMFGYGLLFLTIFSFFATILAPLFQTVAAIVFSCFLWMAASIKSSTTHTNDHDVPPRTHYDDMLSKGCVEIEDLRKVATDEENSFKMTIVNERYQLETKNLSDQADRESKARLCLRLISLTILASIADLLAGRSSHNTLMWKINPLTPSPIVWLEDSLIAIFMLATFALYIYGLYAMQPRKKEQLYVYFPKLAEIRLKERKQQRNENASIRDRVSESHDATVSMQRWTD
jgi:hypothetical protein